MIVKKDSWHYKMLTGRLLTIGSWYPHNSLCLYFWQVVFKMVLGFFAALFLASPLVSLIVLGLNQTDAGLFISLLVVWGLLMSLAYVCLVTILLWKFSSPILRRCKRWMRRESVERYSEPKPSLIAEYLKARKEKMCPVIEFKE